MKLLWSHYTHREFILPVPSSLYMTAHPLLVHILCRKLLVTWPFKIITGSSQSQKKDIFTNTKISLLLVDSLEYKIREHSCQLQSKQSSL